MKKFFALCLSVLCSYGCSSDCLVCHPKLKPLEYNTSNPYYKQHHFLISCTKCHPNHNDKSGKCGADCFDCHSRQKLINTPIPQHQKLSTCTKCHKQKQQNIFAPKNNILNFTQ